MLSFVWLWLPNLYHLRISDQFRNSFLFQSFCSNHDLGILRVRYFHTVLQRRSYVLCNKSIKSKRLACSGDVIYFQRRRVPTSQCKLRQSRANSRLYKWAEHGDLFTLQIIRGRAPSIRAEPTSSRWARPT